ncbi:retention module-containing protein [Campylobacter concisus]|uniref:retention module-containing protein n=1 Tax=Campylobacter concisus TaxID=199 RepID=UPI00165F950A|nr:retention module-containing protein [Campylobacter concisus]
MAKKLGTIKSISGSAEVIAVDKSGNQRVLKVGNSLYEGETVKTTSADSKVVIATNNGKELSMIGEDTLSLDPKATAADSQVAALQKALLNGANLEDLEETAAGGNSGGRGDGMSLGETRFEHGGHYSNISASTSAINPLGAASFAGPVEGKSGGLDSGRGGSDGDTAGAGTTIDPETTRKPSNPEIKFPEDTNKDGKISDDENKAGDNDAGKTTAEISIPKDGSVKPGDKLVVTDENGKQTEKTIEQGDIDNGNIKVPVDLNPGKDNTITAEIINPNNPNNPGKDSKVIGEDSENTKAPEAPVITEVIDDVKGYGEDTKVGNVLDVKGHLTNDKTPTIKGTAKAGSKVEIYDNGDKIGETIAKANGSWEFEAPALTKQGEHKFTATAENKFGKSTPSNEATIDLDSIAPKLDNVKITPIDTNSRADDTAELTMGTGHTDTPNAEILFRDENNNIIGKGHANSAGDFLIQLDKAVQPGTPVVVQAIDKAGNAGTEMATAGNIEHPNDTKGPKVDIDTVTPVDDTNPSDGTPDKGIVKGKSDEPNAPVVVTDENGKTIGTGTTDDKGNFEITTDPIKPGDKVKVEVTDKAGHKGSDTETAGDTEFVDNTPPSVEVKEVTPVDTNNPADGNPDKGIVKGKSDEPNAPVVVTDENGKTIGTGTTDDKGNFEITTDPIKPGDKVKVEVTDKAGNKGNGEGTAGNIEHPNDHTAPSEPTITFVEDLKPKDGKLNKDENSKDSDNANTTAKISIPTDAVVGDVIKYTVNGGAEESHTITNADKTAGHVEIKVPVADGQTSSVTAKIVDQAGNASKEVSGSIDVDLTIGNPKVRFLEDTDNNGVLSVAEVAAIKDGKAHWVIDIPTDGSIKAGDVIQSIDSKGNWVKFVTITDEMIKDGRFEATFNVDIEKLRNGKYETPEYRFADEAGNVSESSKASLTLDSEFSRQPSNPSITFPEDNDPKDGKISDKENKAGDNDAGKTTAEISIPKDGSVKPGDKLIVKDNSDKPKEHVITEKDIENGKVEVTVDIKTGDKTTITAEIVNPNNPNNPSEEISKDITEASSTVQVTIDEIYDDVAGGVVNGDVKNGLTNDNLPTFKGSAAPGATVEIYESFLTTTEKTLVGKTVADANGKWSFTPTEAMGDGLHYFEAHATDSAGNKSITPKVELDVDATAPSVENLKVSPLDISNPADNTPEKGRVEGSSDTQDAKVIVKDEAGNVIGEGKVGGDGKFVIDTTKALNPGDKVKVEITDEAGNTGKGSAVTGNDIIHTHATTQVTIDEIYDDVAGGVVNGDVKNGLTNDNLPTFKGSAAPGATVEIYESFLTTTEKTLVGKTVADANGKWSFTPTEAMGDGEHYFEAVATDKVGNKSTSDRVSLDVDTFTDAPVIDAVNDNVDSQTGNVLDAKTKVALTNDSTPTLEGYAEPNSVITIYEISELNGEKTSIGTVTADKHGGWKFELPELGDGEYKYTTRAQDKAGNISDFSEVVVVNADLIAPSEPTITFVEDVNPKDGKLNKAENSKDGDSTSTKAQISVPGDAEENDVIHYTINGEEKTHTITYNDRVTGYIEIKVPVVDGKASSVTAKIVDQAGNASKEVSSSIDSDFTAPNVKITGIIDNVEGGVYKGNVAGTNTNDNKPTIKGTADANQKVVLYDNNKEMGRVTADKDGNWEFKPSDYKEPLADLVGRVHVIKAVVTDAAGNTSEATSALEVDTTIGAPKVSIKEDADHNGVLSVDEAKNLKDSKIHWEVEIPKDGTVSAGDVLQVLGKDGKWKTEKVLSNDDLGKSFEYEAILSEKHFESPSYRIVDLVGNQSTAIHANVQLDSEFSRKPSNPEIKFPEDTNKDGKISDDENKANDNDAGKTTVEVTIPKDGSVKPGDKVVVTDDNGKKTEKPINQDDIDKGKIDIPVDLNPGKDNNVTAEIINPNNPNNPGKDSKVIGEDSENTKAPEAPVITEVIDNQRGGKFNEDVKGGLTNDSTPTFKGTAKPGTTITLKNGNDLIADNIPVKTNGSWEFTLKTPLAEGDYSITATAKNAAGKVSDPSDAATIKIDLHSDEPVITEIIDNVAGGVVNGDVKGGLTNDNTPTLKGTAEPFATVEIKIDGRGSYRFENGEVISNWTAVADKDGNWEFTTPKLSDGHHNFEAQATDVAGNNSQPSALVSIDVDTHIDAPVITAVTDNWWGGVENGGNILGVNDGFTNDTTPTFKGTAEAGSTIVLKNGNDIINKDIIVKADANGNWEFTPKSPLAEGEYNVVAIATDKAGNVSNPSNVATVNVDISTTQPVITEIIDDVAGGVVGNVKNALTNDNLPTLKGTAEAFSTVKIMVDDRLVFKDGKEVTVTADKDGNWEYTFEANLNWGGKVHAALEDGVHTLKVQTTDRAGNRSAVSEWSSVDVDKTIGIPKVKITTDTNGDKKIDIDDASALKDGKLKWVIEIPENTVKAGDRVQILGSDAKTWTDIFKVTAQDIAKGFIERDEFSIDMPKSRGFQTPSYRLVDDAGNVSEGSMDAVKIVGFAPKAPTIIAVLDNEYGIDPKDPISINAGDTTGNVLEGVIAITNDNTPTLMGKAEAGTTITLKKGNTVIADNIPVDANGSWHYEPEENSPWADGDYKITAIAKNIFGKESESSSPITVTVDTTGPEVTLTSIEDSVKNNDVVDFTGNVKDKFTNDNTPVLKGTAEAGSVIIIKYGEHHENEVTTKADKNGHWEYKITNPLSDGEHIISYQAVDKAGNTSLEYVANVTVDTKIADAKVEFIEDTNNDGKFSWKENIENPNIGRMAWKALIPNDGSIKAGDTFNYRWGASDSWHNRTITQADIDRGYIGEKVQNQYEQGQPNAGKPLAFGANANGRVYEAEAYFSDAAGNQGKVGSDKVVFDFSDKPADPVKNIKINAEAIYGDNNTGLLLEGHGPVLKASTELQPQLNGNDNYEIDVKTITHKAEFTLGSGDDIVNIHKSGNGWGWINMDSKIDLGDGNNRLTVAADLDSSTVISGKGDDYIEIKDDVANGAKIITGAGNDTVIVGDTVANTIFTKVGISTGDGNDSVTIKGDAIDKAKIDLGNGDDTLTIKAAHVIGGVDDKGALDGGKGYDKLIISSPEDTIDLKHVSYHAKNFEELDISGDKNTTLKVGIKDVLDMTDDKHTLKITGDKGDVVDLKEDVKGSGWHQGASEDGYTTYTNNTVTIQIKDEIHVI